MITLSVGSITIELDPDLYWSDENAWNPIQQEVKRTITGALDVQVGALTGARPITLEPEDEQRLAGHIYHRGATPKLSRSAG